MANFSPFSLTSLDHALLAVYILQNLCFRTSDHQQCPSRLQAGINLLLTRLPFLSGEVAKPGELCVQPGNTFDEIPMLTIKHFTHVILPPVLIGGSNSLKTDHAVASLDSQLFPLPLTLPPSDPRPVMRLQANVVADGVILSMAAQDLNTQDTRSNLQAGSILWLPKQSTVQRILPLDHLYSDQCYYPQRLLYSLQLMTGWPTTCEFPAGSLFNNSNCIDNCIDN